MSCKYYYFDRDYCCSKKEGDHEVDSDWYYKYCRNYDYDDCPIYKSSDSSGGCFLTSACTEAMGLPDDCDELTTLRHFRDTYLRSHKDGEKDIQEYYRVAPSIVRSIKTHDDSKKIFNEIYKNLVLPCVHMIKEEQYEAAYHTYKRYTTDLCIKYGC